MMQRLLMASGNAGKLREFRGMALQHAPEMHLDLIPDFAQIPPFIESAPTFAENAAGKALHYSRFTEFPIFADDSGLAVDALGGAPGVQSARYAGPNASDADRVAKLLAELRAAGAKNRRACFVCVLALAQRGEILAIISDAVEGVIADQPRGGGGFGYDPVFVIPELGQSFSELSGDMKHRYSHRGKAFRKLLRHVTEL
jgi:XTP/dITP diphosphohydrolase